MYATILVTLDVSSADRVILEHIKQLAKKMGSHIVLLHVADGWAARRFGQEAVSEETIRDTVYLADLQAEFTREGIEAETVLAYGEPADEIVKWVKSHNCDLIAMSTHGHKGLTDLLLGWTASRVQHEIDVPVLMLRAKRKEDIPSGKQLP